MGRLLPVVTILFALLSSVFSVIPRSCAPNITASPAVCCPTPRGYRHACGYPHRGVCQKVQVKTPWKVEHFDWIYKHDVRQLWPKRVFQHLCECIDNFAGPDCSVCRWGWEGSLCQRRVRYQRINVNKFTADMRRKFQLVLLESRRRVSDYVWPLNLGNKISGLYRNMSVQEELVTIHWLASYSTVSGDPRICHKFKKRVNYNHQGPSFAFWHRYFMLLWEMRTRNIAIDMFGWKNFTFPYWDWTNAKKCDVCTNDLVCETSNIRSKGGGFLLSKQCPLSHWKVICSDVELKDCAPCYSKESHELLNREFLTNRYPSNEHIRNVLAMPEYYSSQYKCSGFAELFEGPINHCICELGIHDMVHMNINGPFNRSITAANDFLFIFHHSQLDRLLQRWFVTVYPSSEQFPIRFLVPGHTRSENMIGFIPAVSLQSMFADVRSLGYDYDNYDFGDVKASEKIKVLKSLDEFASQYCDPHSRP